MAEGICYGRTDLALAEDAGACAARLAPLLPAELPVYSSPLARCLPLARRLAAEPRVDARLMEVDFGAWEMRAWDDIGRAALDAWAADPLGYAGHGGESIGALHARVAAFLAELATDAVLVTHAGVMKACAAHLLGLPPERWFNLRFDYGSASLIEGGRLVWHNTSHG